MGDFEMMCRSVGTEMAKTVHNLRARSWREVKDVRVDMVYMIRVLARYASILRAQVVRLTAERDEAAKALVGNVRVREAARRRMPLDGADAQAMEGALTLTESERDEAIARADKAGGRIAEMEEEILLMQRAVYFVRDYTIGYSIVDRDHAQEILNDLALLRAHKKARGTDKHIEGPDSAF